MTTNLDSLPTRILVIVSTIASVVFAHKTPSVRACRVLADVSARREGEDDDLNGICLGGVVIGHALAMELVKPFLAVEMSDAGRHPLGLAKVAELKSVDIS